MGNGHVMSSSGRGTARSDQLLIDMFSGLLDGPVVRPNTRNGEVSHEKILKHCAMRFCAGDHLDTIVQAMEQWNQKQLQASDPLSTETADNLDLSENCLIQTCCQLIGPFRTRGLLLGIDDGKLVKTLEDCVTDKEVQLILFFKLSAATYLHDLPSAKALVNHTKQVFKTRAAPSMVQLYCSFYEGLVEAAMSRQARGRTRQRKHITAARKNLENLRLLAAEQSNSRICDAVLKNKLYLLEAEVQASDGHNDEAMLLYHRSIEYADMFCLIQEQGLAYEKAGLILDACGRSLDARLYLAQARDCYEQWGAYHKVDQLDCRIETLQATELNIR